MEKLQQINDWYNAPVPEFQTKKAIYRFIWLFLALVIVNWIFKPHFLILVLLFAGIIAMLYFQFLKPFLADKARYNGRPKDDQIDKWLEEDLNKVIDNAIKKFDIDEEDEDELKAPSFIICSPIGGAHNEGFDGKHRDSCWKVHILFFKEDSILYYNTVYDTLQDIMVLESNERVFYKDIISTKVEDTGGTTFTLVGTDISIYYSEILPVHGKNRTSDVNFTVRAIEKLMQSTKYKTSQG